MTRLIDLLFVALLLFAAVAPVEAKPFRSRSKAVARVPGAKAKAVTRGPRIRRISVETTPEEAVKAGATGQQRWSDWDRQSRRDVPGQGRQNDDLR